MRRGLTKPPLAQTVAPGASAIIQRATQVEIGDADVYLDALGTAIDPVSNANFATIRLRVNGVPFYPLEAVTSQIGTPSQFQKLPSPLYLGKGVSVEIFGEMDAGATGNTSMIAGFSLILTTPGERP